MQRLHKGPRERANNISNSSSNHNNGTNAIPSSTSIPSCVSTPRTVASSSTSARTHTEGVAKSKTPKAVVTRPTGATASATSASTSATAARRSVTPMSTRSSVARAPTASLQRTATPPPSTTNRARQTLASSTTPSRAKTSPSPSVVSQRRAPSVPYGGGGSSPVVQQRQPGRAINVHDVYATVEAGIITMQQARALSAFFWEGTAAERKKAGPASPPPFRPACSPTSGVPGRSASSMRSQSSVASSSSGQQRGAGAQALPQTQPHPVQPQEELQKRSAPSTDDDDDDDIVLVCYHSMSKMHKEPINHSDDEDEAKDRDGLVNMVDAENVESVSERSPDPSTPTAPQATGRCNNNNAISSPDLDFVRSHSSYSMRPGVCLPPPSVHMMQRECLPLGDDFDELPVGFAAAEQFGSFTSSQICPDEPTCPAEADAADSPTSLRPCMSCGRTFAQLALERHEPHCKGQQSQRRRQVFDSSKQRAPSEIADVVTSPCQSPLTTPRRQGESKSKWRQDHEVLQKAMRAGREPQTAHKKMDNEDGDDMRVPCPHCQRRFAPETAERHIPKCANIKHKPTTLVRHSTSMVKKNGQSMN
eukprot:PhM_4_TR15119/c0_g1_i1/m.78946